MHSLSRLYRVSPNGYSQNCKAFTNLSQNQVVFKLIFFSCLDLSINTS